MSRSSRNTEQSENSLLQALRFAIDQAQKGLNTARPGIVESYDPATRRARVVIALDRLLNDGTLVGHPPIADVPVIFPSGGGYVVHLPLARGDPVMLIFSDRGLEAYKKSYRRAAPDADAIMSEKDAVAFPGFGPLEQELPVTDGAYLGTVAGDEYVSIKAGEMKLIGSGSITLQAPDEILFDGPVRATGAAEFESTMEITGETTMQADLQVNADIDLTGEVDGVDVAQHTHLNVQPGSGKSGIPG